MYVLREKPKFLPSVALLLESLLQNPSKDMDGGGAMLGLMIYGAPARKDPAMSERRISP